MSLEEQGQNSIGDLEASELTEGPLEVPKITIHGPNRLFSIALQFVVLFAFWLLLSGRYEAREIIIGAISAALVTILTNDLFYAVLQRGERLDIRIRQVLLQLWRFLLYLPWLAVQIIMANVQVAYLVLHPRMPIEPVLLLFHTRMRKGMAQVTLGNSITLTPGTITTSLENGNYIVHTLKPPLASGLVEGKMQGRIARVYLEDDEEQKPEVRWIYSLEELKK